MTLPVPAPTTSAAFAVNWALAAPARRTLARPEHAVFWLAGGTIAFIVLWPVLWLLAGSFFTDDGQLTLRHWYAAARAPFMIEAAYNTLVVSIAGTVVAVVLGTALAFFVGRTNVPGARFFEMISLVPFITPPIVSGIAWIILGDREAGLLNVLLNDLGFGFKLNLLSLEGLIFVSSLYMVPFVFFLTVGPMRQVNAELEEASAVCGASRIATALKVTIPLLTPAIASGALLAFMYSNNLFGIHAVIGRPADVWMLTTAIYASMNIMPVDFHRAAIQGLVLLVFAAAAIGIQRRFIGRRGYATLTGKGFRAERIGLGPWRWLAFAVCGLYVFVVVALPYAVIVLRSLSRYSFQPGQSWLAALRTWDLSEYVNALLHDPASQRAIANSLWLSILAAAAAMSLAAVAAYVVQRTPLRGRSALSFICMIPLTLPGVVLGVAAIFGYTAYPFALYGTIWIIFLAYVAKDLPLAYQAADTSLRQIHVELEDSARLCGASWFRQFRTVTLPLAGPGATAGFIMVFASMTREVGASILLFSPGNEIFAYTIFNAWEEGRWQAMTSFIVINSTVVLACIAAFRHLSRLAFTEIGSQRTEPKRP